MPIPILKPQCPNFGSGPCAKRPGWTPQALESALLGRSHRSTEAKERISLLISKLRLLLELPDDFLLGITPGSATGALEVAFWSLLGPRAVECIVFDVFSKRWANDLQSLEVNLNINSAPPGELPNLLLLNQDHDIVLNWNGSTTGAMVPNGDWIRQDRNGLIICDATSIAFASPLPWDKLDVVAFSWQKALGGEGGNGMLAFSPRAWTRLLQHQPKWPLPYLLNLHENKNLFNDAPINTISMLCVEDALDAANWALSIGGSRTLYQRTLDNFSVIQEWVEKTPWIAFMAKDPQTFSPTSICLTFTDKKINTLPLSQQWNKVKLFCEYLKSHQVAYDICNHNLSLPSIRIWGGPTVETTDLQALLPWLELAYTQINAGG